MLGGIDGMEEKSEEEVVLLAGVVSSSVPSREPSLGLPGVRRSPQQLADTHTHTNAQAHAKQDVGRWLTTEREAQFASGLASSTSHALFRVPWMCSLIQVQGSWSSLLVYTISYEIG